MIYVYILIIYVLFWSFLYKIYVVKGSDVCHNTYFTDEYNLNPVHMSFMVYPTVIDRKDIITSSILKSQGNDIQSGNSFWEHLIN